MSKRKMVLSMNADSKTIKGLKQGFLTGILYLAPHDLGGKSICANAVNAGCIDACLYTAGRGGFNSVQTARLNKTDRFHNDFNNFFDDIIWSIAKIVRKAAREGLKPCIRLNGTSDINWQVTKRDGLNIFEHFPLVQFYDYTKIPQQSKHDNYHLTFSYSGLTSFNKSVSKALALNMSIAVVFATKILPEIFLGKEVINGDESDLRFLDNPGKVVGLYAKGKARKDISGFVQHLDSNSIPLYNI